MNFTNEMLEKAKKAASAEELIKLAAEEGITLTPEEAENYYSFLFGDAALPDDALDAVAGGKGNGKPKPKYSVGQKVMAFFDNDKGYIPSTVINVKFPELQNAWYYTVNFECGGKRDMTAEWIKPC